jgi:hypothetical protein
MRLLTAYNCELCGERFATTRRKERDCVIDHDHHCCPRPFSCGRCIRGIVCHRCNSVVAAVEEVLERSTLDKVIAYLDTRHQGSTTG